MRTYFKVVLILISFLSLNGNAGSLQFSIANLALSCQRALQRNSSVDEALRYFPSLLPQKELLEKFKWKTRSTEEILSFEGVLRKANMTFVFDLLRNKTQPIVAGGGLQLRIVMPTEKSGPFRELLKDFHGSSPGARPHHVLIGEELGPSMAVYNIVPQIFEFASHVTSEADALAKMHTKNEPSDTFLRILKDSVFLEAMRAQEMSAQERQNIFAEFFQFLQASLRI